MNDGKTAEQYMRTALRENEHALRILEDSDDGRVQIRRHIIAANHELRNALTVIALGVDDNGRGDK